MNNPEGTLAVKDMYFPSSLLYLKTSKQATTKNPKQNPSSTNQNKINSPPSNPSNFNLGVANPF